MRTIFFRSLSYVFHPFLILLYLVPLSIAANPFLFGYGQTEPRVLIFLFVFFTGIFIPLIAILMMRALNLIPDLRFSDKKDRIFAFIATGIFYLWLIRNLWSNPDVPLVLKGGVLGVVIALFLSFFVNNFDRISVHSVGAGNLFGFILIAGSFFSLGTVTIPFGEMFLELGWIWLVGLGAIIAGGLGTARLFLKKHTLREVLTGYFIGFSSQWISFFILNS